MEEDRKLSADKVKARRCAQGLVARAKVTSAPIAVNDLVQVAKGDFTLLVSPAPSGTFSGKGDALTQRRGKTNIIIYSDEKPVIRKRFSVAHELGHLYLGHLDGCSSVDINSENFDEIEANVFAANVLMPKQYLKKDIEAGLGAKELVKKYRVSEEALWVQLKDAGLINLLYAKR